MEKKRIGKLERRVTDLRAREMTPDQSRRIRGGSRRTVVFLVPPKELTKK
jgi:hypothetical protein